MNPRMAGWVACPLSQWGSEVKLYLRNLRLLRALRRGTDAIRASLVFCCFHGGDSRNIGLGLFQPLGSVCFLRFRNPKVGRRRFRRLRRRGYCNIIGGVVHSGSTLTAPGSGIPIKSRGVSVTMFRWARAGMAGSDTPLGWSCASEKAYWLSLEWDSSPRGPSVSSFDGTKCGHSV